MPVKYIGGGFFYLRDRLVYKWRLSCHKNTLNTTYIDTLHGITVYQWGQQWACQSRHVMGWLVGGQNDDD